MVDILVQIPRQLFIALLTEKQDVRCLDLFFKSKQSLSIPQNMLVYSIELLLPQASDIFPSFILEEDRGK